MFNLEVISDKLLLIVTVIAILVATTIVATITRVLLNSFFRKSSAFLKLDPTKYTFLKHSVTVIIYTIGIGLAIYMIPALRVLSVSIFAGAGILAAIIGFASQAAFSNIISGIFIVIFKPFRVDDRILIGQNLAGIVEDISLRHTIIRNYENKRIVIPNSIISSETIINSNLVDEDVCYFLEIRVSYETNINRAMEIIRQECEQHPSSMDMRTEEDIASGATPVVVRLISFEESAMILRAAVWAKANESFAMACDLRKSIKEKFDAENIEMPYPHRTIVQKTIDRKPIME